MTRRTLFASLIGAPVAAAVEAETSPVEADDIEILLYGLRKGDFRCILNPGRTFEAAEGIILFDCPLPKEMAKFIYLDEGDGFEMMTPKTDWRPVHLGARSLKSADRQDFVSVNVFYE